jgi:3-phenylpropionate/cinnamic acid dioxygenase small subunit
MDDRDGVDIRRIEAFVFREARLADENRYDEWLSLWHEEEAVYWVPANKDDYDPRRHVSIIYDRWERLQARVDRLKSGAAWSQEPQSRMRRIVSNVEIDDIRADGVIVVRSNFVLGELRRELQTAYFAAQEHHLRPVGSGLKMSLKKVMLINNNEPLHNLSFLV